MLKTSRRLPSLNALRAFEAAARHLSFTKAADELAVTQGAVSHQVKALEAELGVQLFHRFHHGLALTTAGQTYLPVVRDAFDHLSFGTSRDPRALSAAHARLSARCNHQAGEGEK
jgi:LysR family transcriptional regulator, glycine cleavage system transcriptional activator